MPLKKFDDYLVGRSTDSSVFEKKVIFATRGVECFLFKTVSEESEIFSTIPDSPVVIWGDFKFTPKIINENRFSLYNMNQVPQLGELYEAYSDSSFVPKFVKERQSVSSLQFPIVASNDFEKIGFKTYNSFKKSEKDFKLFSENPKIDNKFDVMVFRNEPIHIQENIRDIGFDVSLNNFKHLHKIKEAADLISKRYVLDLYQLNFGESGGKLYLTGVNRSNQLSPTQRNKAYESIYEHHYSRKLPVWFKNSILENNIKDYYRKSYYNSLLLKPKYSINFEKFVK
jgi:hypothetical protein